MYDVIIVGVARGQQSTGANQYPAPPATPPCPPPPRNGNSLESQLTEYLINIVEYTIKKRFNIGQML